MQLRNLLILFLFFVALLTTSLILLNHQTVTPEQLDPAKAKLGEITIGGPFELKDGKGHVVTPERFRGRWMLVFFGFASCPDICPTTLSNVAQALQLLGDDAAKVVPIFITVDPERDTPKIVSKYAAGFDPRIVGLSGTPEQVKQAAEAYKVYFAKAPGGSEKYYMMDHSGYIYLMSDKGMYVRHFPHSAGAEEIASAIRAYLK